MLLSKFDEVSLWGVMFQSPIMHTGPLTSLYEAISCPNLITLSPDSSMLWVLSTM